MGRYIYIPYMGNYMGCYNWLRYINSFKIKLFV